MSAGSRLQRTSRTPKDASSRRLNLTLTRFLPRPGAASTPIDWGAVYTQELPRVYNYLRYRTGDDALAEDLTAGTFEKAWRAREDYRRDLGAFSTWLITIACNLATDELRHHRDEIPLDNLHHNAALDNTEQTVARREELSHLNSLLAELPDRERELLAYKYGAELTNRDIARQTGLSESNVGTTLHRVVAKLRAQWEKRNNGD